jgi:hypothetical protein
MYIGQVYRSRIRQRTLAGIDVNGASFTPYSTKGPTTSIPTVNRERLAGHARMKPPGRKTKQAKVYAKAPKPKKKALIEPSSGGRPTASFD